MSHTDTEQSRTVRLKGACTHDCVVDGGSSSILHCRIHGLSATLKADWQKHVLEAGSDS